jgi:hypothetical protein
MNEPKLTVITALLEFNQDLIDTFESIRGLISENKINWIIKYSQNQVPQEMLAIFNSYPNIITVAEVDSGIYEALNRALEFVKTEYYIVLGAGDKFFQNSLDILNLQISKNPQADGFIFSVAYPDIIKCPQLNHINFRMPGNHQGIVLNTKKTIDIGKFDVNYKYASDYDLFSRYILAYPNIESSNKEISYFKNGGASENNLFECALEVYLIVHRHWKHTHSNILDLHHIVINGLNRINSKMIEKQKIMTVTSDSVSTKMDTLISNIEDVNKKIDVIYKALDFASRDYTELKSLVDNMIKPQTAVNGNISVKQENKVFESTNENKDLSNVISSKEALKNIFKNLN